MDSAPATSGPLRTRATRQARIHLVCVPHAGAGASCYVGWRALLPATVALHAVQLPGREDRFREAPPASLTAAADHLVPYLLGLARSGPLVLFGHSMGGLLAFATARLLEAHGVSPAQVIVAGCLASDHPVPRQRLGHLDDEAFTAALAELGGLPDELRRSPDLAMFLPTLRADIRMAEEYYPPATAPLRAPLAAFGGDTDRTAPPEGVGQWRHYTIGGFEWMRFPGAHFFVNSARVAVVASVNAVLDRLLPAQDGQDA